MVSTTNAASLLLFVTAAVVLVVSQFPVARTGFAPDDIPLLRKTLEVPFNGDSLHGAHGSIFQKGGFTVNVSLEANSSYVIDVCNSDFMVDVVTVKDSDGETLTVEKNSLFETISPGIHTIFVSGHYMFSMSTSWHTPGIGHTGGGGVSAAVDDIVDVTVTALIRRTESYALYASIWPLSALLWLISILAVSQKPVKTLIRSVKARFKI